MTSSKRGARTATFIAVAVSVLFALSLSSWPAVSVSVSVCHAANININTVHLSTVTSTVIHADIAIDVVTLSSAELLVILDDRLPRPSSLSYITSGETFASEGSAYPASCASESASIDSGVGADLGFSFPPSCGCVTLISVDGSGVDFCAARAETAVSYSVLSATAADFTLTLQKTSLAASASVQGRVELSAASEFQFTVNAVKWITHQSNAAPNLVRAVDMDFPFVTLTVAGTQFYYSNPQKNWCTIGNPCQEWSYDFIIDTIPGPDTDIAHTDVKAQMPRKPVKRGVRDEMLRRNLGGADSVDVWPPSPLPWAAAALERIGRVGGVGAWTSKTGIGFSSSSPTLPYQLFTVNASASAVGAGMARMNAMLRCGSVLPSVFRISFFQDISGDGLINQDDSIVYGRSRLPLAASVYRSSLMLKVQNDMTSYLTQAAQRRITFNDTLQYVQAVHDLSDGTPILLYLTGWQGTGHDTLFPSLDGPNEQLGSSGELVALVEAAKRLNTLISYHINTDEAYINYTAVQADGNATAGHPVPGTKDAQWNPDANVGMVASLPDNGGLFPWADNAADRSDPFLGGSYHVSKTKDVVSGQRLRRLDAMFKAIPLSTSIHCDAYRDINVSFENDTLGYIAEDEEALCGIAWDATYFLKQAGNIVMGVEGGNGMAAAIGPNPPMAAFASYYYHGDASLGDWARIVIGGTQGLDDDIAPGSSTNPFTNWAGLADKVYTQALVYLMQLTDTELLSNGRFSGGGDMTSVWPYCGALIKYRHATLADTVFVPAVMQPEADAPLNAPTRLNEARAYVYIKSTAKSAATQWTIPTCWQGKTIQAETITPTGRLSGPAVTVDIPSNTFTVNATAARPIVLSVS